MAFMQPSDRPRGLKKRDVGAGAIPDGISKNVQRGNRDYVSCSGVYTLPIGVLKFEKQARNRWELDFFCPSPWECFFKEKPITGDVPVYRAELLRRLKFWLYYPSSLIPRC